MPHSRGSGPQADRGQRRAAGFVPLTAGPSWRGRRRMRGQVSLALPAVRKMIRERMGNEVIPGAPRARQPPRSRGRAATRLCAFDDHPQRALPDVRDGLKPATGAALAMRQLRLDPGSGYKNRRRRRRTISANTIRRRPVRSMTRWFASPDSPSAIRRRRQGQFRQTIDGDNPRRCATPRRGSPGCGPSPRRDR